jgi:hypothetical protein
MKKILITFTIGLTCISKNINAEYIVKFKLDGNINVTEWVSKDVLYGEWENIGDFYNCNNWSPSPSTIKIGENFQQLANDCKQNQERTAQNQEIDKLSGNIRNIGDFYINTRTINVENIRNAVGTKENWIPTTPSYGDWTNNGSVYNCSGWTPDASTGDIGTTVNQTSSNCSINQTRTVQNREIETTIGKIRNVGDLQSESRIENGQIGYQSVAGTKSTYLYDYNSTYIFVCAAAGPDLWQTKAVYGGSQVLLAQGNTRSGPSCNTALKTGVTFNGTDGRSYTIGPQQTSRGRGAEYGLKRN